MKVYLLVMFIGMFLALTFTVAGQPRSGKIYVTAVKANVREYPSATSKVIFTVDQGEVLTLGMKSDYDGWYAVKLESKNLSGWISKTVVKDYKLSEASLYSENPKTEQTNDEPDYKDEWVDLGNKESFYNPSTISIDGYLIRVWLKTLIKDGTSRRHYMSINCSADKYALIKVVYYDQEGFVEKANNYEAPLKYTPIVPDSVAKVLAKEVCKSTK